MYFGHLANYVSSAFGKHQCLCRVKIRSKCKCNEPLCTLRQKLVAVWAAASSSYPKGTGGHSVSEIGFSHKCSSALRSKHRMIFLGPITKEATYGRVAARINMTLILRLETSINIDFTVRILMLWLHKVSKPRGNLKRSLRLFVFSPKESADNP